MEQKLTKTNGEVHLYMLRVGGDRITVDPDVIPKDAYGLVSVKPIVTVEDFWKAYNQLANE